MRGGSTVRLAVEILEDRTTPAGNIVITSSMVVDSSANPLSVVNPGEPVYIRANFTTQGLPSGASYRVSNTVNGFTEFTSFTNAGAGNSGTQSWFFYWGVFIPTAGTNQVKVTVDPDQSVPESSYTDNTINFTFTTTGGPPAVATIGSPAVRRARARESASALTAALP